MGKRIPKDSAMLVDIQYVKENKKEGIPDILYIVWKDLDTNEKHLTTIPNPPVDIYFEKPEYRNTHLDGNGIPYSLNYQYLDRTIKKTVPYKDIISAIIEDGGDGLKTQAADIYRTKRYSELKNFLMYPYVYGADYDVRALYRYKWMTMYDNDRPKPISKAFCDIETDFLDVDGIANPETCPIDLVTLVDDDESKCYTFALVGREYVERDMTYMSQSERDKELYRRELHASRLKQEIDFIEHQEEIKKELHEMFDESYGVLDYKFFFYKDERKMITHLFELINRRKFDFVTFWNFEFDVNYIYKRANVLGIDPRDLFCHPDFPVKECWFKKDNFHFDIKSKTDYFFTTSYTNYTCQMRTYAAIRKGQSEIRSFSLNYIGKKVVKDSKLDYGEEGSIKYFPYRNYKKYFIYNIKDVLLQKGIEDNTKDLENYYATAYQNITQYDSEFKQTVKLRNYQYYDFLTSGMVPGENVNMSPFDQAEEEPDDDDEDTPKKKVGFEGALVGDPRLNLPTGMCLYGNKKSNNIFQYAIDMDMSSFYPSTIFAMNVDPSALHFKCYLDASQFSVLGGDKKINTYSHVRTLPKEASDFHDDVAKEAFDNFQTRNWLCTGHKWFNLPSVHKLYKTVSKELGVT